MALYLLYSIIIVFIQKIQTLNAKREVIPHFSFDYSAVYGSNATVLALLIATVRAL